MEYSSVDLMIAGGVSLLAGFLDAIAGGGGLLVVPSLLLLGVPTLNSLAISKFQSAFGTAYSLYYFVKKKLIDLKKVWMFPIVGFIFGAIGTKCISLIPNDALKIVIPILLIFSSLYVLFSPSMSDIDRHKSMKVIGYATLVAPFIAFYDGFFGPASGSFYTISLVAFLGYNSSKASAHAKLLNLFSKIGALSFYITNGYLLWDFGIVMAITSILGSLVGSKLVFLKGTKVVKPFLVAVSLAVCIKIIWEALHG